MKPAIVSETPPSSPSRRFWRPRIVDRYLFGEIALAFLAAVVVLVLVLVGGTFADLMTKIARGRIPAELLFTLLGLRSVAALTILMPLAVLIGVLLACGRLWRESEMAVLRSAGIGPGGLLRPLLAFLLPAAALLALIAFWLAPAADRLGQHKLEEANRSLIVAGLEPGRFVDLPGREGVLYVGEMSDDGTRFARMFIESERVDPETGERRIDGITATHGFLYHDADGEGRYIALQDGFRVEGRFGHDDFRLMRFARNDIRLPDSVVGRSAEDELRAAPTLALLRGADEPGVRAELDWRLAAPVAAIVLGLLALPLARSNPREPRYARLLLALLAWLAYYNLLLIGRAWIAQDRFGALGLWWIHVPALLLAAWMLWREHRLPRRRQAAEGAT